MPEKETKRKPRKEGEELIDPTDALFGMAVQLAKQAGGVALLACVGASLLPSLQEWVGKAPMLIASSAHNLTEEFKGALKGFIELPTLRLSRLGQIKLAVVLGMAQGLITPNDTLVCLAGPPNAHRLDTLLWLTVREELELFAGSERLLVEHVNPEVFEQVLDIAIQLSAEGREGKPVGALFVVGDYENVARYTTQLVLNPFKGYDEKERNILDPRLTETVKEFCAIDGAFLIRGDGVIEAAGAVLHPGVPRGELPVGVGGRGSVHPGG
ncbi:MAG: hypothetical protein PVTTEEND_000010, partial [Candidatus Fervidibacter sp.]